MSLEPTEVLAAARAWVYVPPDAHEVTAPDHRLIAFPTTWSTPTVATWLDSSGPAGELVDAVMSTAAGLGRDDVWFWTDGDTRPADLVEELLARGATLDEELAVLARPLGDLPDLEVPADVEVRAVTDLDSMREHDRVGVQVFGGHEVDEETLLAQVERIDPASGLGFVARRGGEAIATAGLTVAGSVARLWGGAVLPAWRGTGAYRALLDHRLRVAVDLGCDLALVKGRVETSAPVLRRAGFASYGVELSHRLAR